MASNMGIYGCLAVVALLLHVAAVAAGIKFPVKWPITPSTGDDYYRTWAAGKKFKVGDVLEFHGVDHGSDVLEVPKKVYDTCDMISSALKAKAESTPVNISISTNGTLYYRCTDPVRCNGGQKFAINVSNSDGTVTPSASPSESSSSLTVSGFFITLASYIVAFLY